MSDVETKTEWSHLLGRAMAGKLQGARLESVVSDMSTWGVWRKENPDTTVLDMSRTTKNYTSEFYRDAEKFVFGFELGGKHWHAKISQLIKQPIHSIEMDERHFVLTFDETGMVARLFEARVNQVNLDFKKVDVDHMQDTQTSTLWGIASGEAVRGPLAGTRLEQRVGIMSYLAAWLNFHPSSRELEF